MASPLMIPSTVAWLSPVVLATALPILLIHACAIQPDCKAGQSGMKGLQRQHRGRHQVFRTVEVEVGSIACDKQRSLQGNAGLEATGSTEGHACSHAPRAQAKSHTQATPQWPKGQTGAAPHRAMHASAKGQQGSPAATALVTGSHPMLCVIFKGCQAWQPPCTAETNISNKLNVSRVSSAI